jgi:DNA-binding NtrC family response regulator
MPRMRGPETLEKIKQIHPSQIVIIFSSSSDPFYVFEAGAKQKGAFDCIYKPFELHDLLTVIDAARNKLEKTT